MCPRALSIVLTLLASNAGAAEPAVRLRAAADSELEARVLADRMTVGLWAQGVAPKVLRTALQAFDAATADCDLVPDPQSNADVESIAYLHFEAPVGAATTDWSAGFWTLNVEPEDVGAALAARVASRKLVLPGGVDTLAMRQADAQLMQRDNAAAKLAYTALLDVYALAAWASLRLGDIALIENDVEGACALWQSVDRVSPGRVAGTLANLRARAMRCPGAAMPDWYALLMRRGRDDLVGQRLRDDTRWALQYETDQASLESALAAGEASLTSPVFEQVWARVLRHNPPQEVVRLGARPDVPLWSHPEGIDLALTVGRAWCALEVPTNAGAQVARLPRKNWLTLRPQALRAMASAVGTCHLGGSAASSAAAEAQALTRAASPAAQLRDALDRLDTRLDNVAQVLSAEPLLAEETP